MYSIQNQINYWINGAEEDLLTAQIPFEKKRILHGLFFCHLVIEKAFKALCVNKTGEIPPRTHNLIVLSEIANLDFDIDNQVFIGILMKYQLEGRYPDYNPNVPKFEKALEYLGKTKELFQWLRKKLLIYFEDTSNCCVQKVLALRKPCFTAVA